MKALIPAFKPEIDLSDLFLNRMIKYIFLMSTSNDIAERVPVSALIKEIHSLHRNFVSGKRAERGIYRHYLMFRFTKKSKLQSTK